jgi:hypothetical protein
MPASRAALGRRLRQVETLGEAYAAGWRVRARCAGQTLGEAYAAGWRVRARSAGQGRTDGPTARSSRECTYRHELDMELDVHFVVHNCPMTMS